MSLLNADEIHMRQDEIFVGTTFSDRCLRAAAYDLRICAANRLDTIGELDGGTLQLATGQHAVLETYEKIAMPWDLAGNVGAKYRMAIRGLFVVPGLFVDPGFGWEHDPETEQLKPVGRRLRFVVTNMGRESIPLRLGPGEDDEDRINHVLSIQFLCLRPARARRLISPVAIDPQSVAFFRDMTAMREEFAEVAAVARQTASSTWHVVVFGVFLLATSLLGAITVQLLTLITAGDTTERLVTAANTLDYSRPATIATLVILGLLALAGVGHLGLQAVGAYRHLFSANDSPPRDTRRPQGDGAR